MKDINYQNDIDARLIVCFEKDEWLGMVGAGFIAILVWPPPLSILLVFVHVYLIYRILRRIKHGKPSGYFRHALYWFGIVPIKIGKWRSGQTREIYGK